MNLFSVNCLKDKKAGNSTIFKLTFSIYTNYSSKIKIDLCKRSLF